MIALTATASIETQAIIKKTLCLTDCLDVIISPNKPNMKYTVHFCDSDDVRLNFSWLIQLLNEKGIETPRMIIFFRKVEHMSTVYKHVVYELRNSSESKQQLDENIRLIDMFHMKTTDSVKESICKSYHDQFGSLRVVLCTTSFSMGLDVKGVNSVVHYGLANDLEDYIQETGRAGRNPNDKCHAILMKYKRCTSSKNISADMKKYVTSITCRRKQILKPFITGLDTDSVSSTISHDCCDICTKSCKCLCNCDDVCGCTVLCSVKLSTISEYMEKAKQTHNSSSSSSEGDSTSIDFLTDSDFEGYISKKPQVMSSDDLSE